MRDRDPVRLVLAGLVVLFAATTGYLYVQDDTIGSGHAGTIVSDTLELETDVSIESVDLTTPSMYRVLADTTPGQEGGITPFYVTSDGEYLLSSPINVTDYRNRYQARSAFIDCLAERGLTVYGNVSSTATRYQIQVFGGSTDLGAIYTPFDSTNRTQLGMVQQAGVQVLPFHATNGTAFAQGVQSINTFEQRTGCEYPYSDDQIRLTTP